MPELLSKIKVDLGAQLAAHVLDARPARAWADLNGFWIDRDQGPFYHDTTSVYNELKANKEFTELLDRGVESLMSAERAGRLDVADLLDEIDRIFREDTGYTVVEAAQWAIIEAAKELLAKVVLTEVKLDEEKWLKQNPTFAG